MMEYPDRYLTNDTEPHIVIRYPDGKTGLYLPRALEMFSVSDWKKFFKLIIGYPYNADIAGLLDQYLPMMADRYEADPHVGERKKKQVRKVYLLWKEMRCKDKN